MKNIVENKFKPDYLFVYINDSDAKKILSHRQFQEHYAERVLTITDHSKGMTMKHLHFPHYNLALYNIENIEDMQKLKGCRYSKVMIANDVAEKIKEECPSLILDILKPITDISHWLGCDKIIVIKEGFPVEYI